MKGSGMACTIRVAILSVLVLACNEPPAERSEPAPSAGLLDRFEEAKRKTMCLEAQQIAIAVEMHLVTDPGKCPADVAALVQAKLLPRVPDSAPSWTIVCNEAEVVVSAPGPDERMGTVDDIVFGGQTSCVK